MSALDRIRRQERVTREELDDALREQELTIARLEAMNAKLLRRCDKLQRMQDANQRYIETLRRNTGAEALFKK